MTFLNSFPLFFCKWTAPLLQRMFSMWNYRRYNENTVSSRSKIRTCKNFTLKNLHSMAIVHTLAFTHTHKCAYTQTKGKQGLVHIFRFICSISVFLFLFNSIMFVAFSTVGLCFNLLYRFVYLLLFSSF